MEANPGTSAARAWANFHQGQTFNNRGISNLVVKGSQDFDNANRENLNPITGFSAPSSVIYPKNF